MVRLILVTCFADQWVCVLGLVFWGSGSGMLSHDAASRRAPTAAGGG